MSAGSPAHRVWGASLLAMLSVIYLGVMLATGARPGQGQFVPFEAAGLLQMPPERVTSVELSDGTRRWRLVRQGDAWHDDAGEALGAEAAAELELGLKVLHVTRPVRSLSRRDMASTPTGYGLDPSPLSGVVHGGGAAFAFAFGASNPNGTLRYMRVDGADSLYLVSPFVADQWLRTLQRMPSVSTETP